MIKIYNDFKILFDSKQNAKVTFLLFISLFTPIFELIGIGAIPAFAILIIDLDKFLLILSNFITFDYLNQISKSSITVLAAICLALIFLIKNLYLFFVIYFQGKILKNLRYETSVNLYKYYINLPYYLEHR